MFYFTRLTHGGYSNNACSHSESFMNSSSSSHPVSSPQEFGTLLPVLNKIECFICPTSDYKALKIWSIRWLISPTLSPTLEPIHLGLPGTVLVMPVSHCIYSWCFFHSQKCPHSIILMTTSEACPGSRWYPKVHDLLSTGVCWLKQGWCFANPSKKRPVFLSLCAFSHSSTLNGISSPKDFIFDILIMLPLPLNNGWACKNISE